MYIYLPIAEVSVNLIILFGMGGAVGILSGMFGVGGGFLMTPLLIFYGIPPIVAVATEANQIVASSISGVVAHWRRRAVDFKMGTVLLIGGNWIFLGIELFALLKNIGQIDLMISLAYVLLLGSIGSLIFVEGIRAIINKRNDKIAQIRKRKRENMGIHPTIQGSFQKIRFIHKCHTSNYYRNICWDTCFNHGGRWRICNGSSNDLLIKDAN